MSEAKGPTDLPLIQKTIAQAFAATCAANGTKLAVHFPQEGAHMTFAKLLTEVRRLRYFPSNIIISQLEL